MSVEVRVPTLLRPHVGGGASVSSEGATVGEVFHSLIAEFPGLAGNLIDGDVLSILPAVAGG